MATESEIESAIEQIVGYYPAWTIGVTDNPTRRKDEHGNPSVWHDWNANREMGARNVEKYFLDKGMKGGGGGAGRADSVYIFV